MDTGPGKRLPLACEAYYQPEFLAAADAWTLFREIHDQYDIEPRELTLADGSFWQEAQGKLMFVAPRLVDPEVFPPEHGRRVAWTSSIEALGRDAAELTGTSYEVCVAIYYPSGETGMGFHYDPDAFGDTSSIASVSLGAERCFQVRSRETGDVALEMTLAHGSLVTMGQGFQDLYEHGIAIDETCRDPRINLTFRQFGWTG